MQINSLQQLQQVLTKYQINYENWQNSHFKGLNDLWKELLEGETTLQEQNGQLFRIVKVGIAEIFYKDNKLIEEKQVFKNGQVKYRSFKKGTVSEKLKPNEDAKQGIIRGIKEELGINLEPHQITNISNFTEESSENNFSNRNYAGLKSIYNIYFTTVYLKENQYNPEGYVEVQPSKTTYFSFSKA